MSIFDKSPTSYIMTTPAGDNNDNTRDLSSVVSVVKTLYGTGNTKLFNSAINQLYKMVVKEKQNHPDSQNINVFITGRNKDVELYPNGMMLVDSNICYNPNPNKAYTVDDVYNATKTISHEMEQRMADAAANSNSNKYSPTKFMKNVINTVVKHDVPLITMLCMGTMLGLTPTYMLKYLSKTYDYGFTKKHVNGAQGLNEEALYTYRHINTNNIAEFRLASMNYDETYWYSPFKGHLPSYLKYLNIQQKSKALIKLKGENRTIESIGVDLYHVNMDYRMILAGLFTDIYGITSAKETYYKFGGYVCHCVSSGNESEFKSDIDKIMVPTTKSLDRLAKLIKENDIKKSLSWGCDVSDDLFAYLEEADIEYDDIDFHFGINPDTTRLYVPAANIPAVNKYNARTLQQLNLTQCHGKPFINYYVPSATGYDVKIETGNIYNLLQSIAMNNSYIANILISADILDKDLSFRVNYDEECLIVKGDISRHEITETSIDEVIDIINDVYDVRYNVLNDDNDASSGFFHQVNCIWDVIPSWKYKDGVNPFYPKDEDYLIGCPNCISNKNQRLDKTLIDEDLREIIMYLASYNYCSLMSSRKIRSISYDGFSEKYLQFSALAYTLTHVLHELQRDKHVIFCKNIANSDNNTITVNATILD